MRATTFGCLAIVTAGALYGAAATTRAQDTPTRPFSVGDTIVLAYSNEGENRCTVGEVRGEFVRCADSKDDTRFTFNRPKTEYWYNLATVKYIARSIPR
ncbi:MAG: hypothetical protein V7647_3915 [Acidobacteriota bacterium]|jgi:hypothetical protein